MVVGTQDKGHKVSNVQVMPLSLGALPSEEVPRCQTAARTGAAGESPRGDINKEQKRASGGWGGLSLDLQGRKVSEGGTFDKRPPRGRDFFFLSLSVISNIVVSITMCYMVTLEGDVGKGWGLGGLRGCC